MPPFGWTDFQWSFVLFLLWEAGYTLAMIYPIRWALEWAIEQILELRAFRDVEAVIDHLRSWAFIIFFILYAPFTITLLIKLGFLEYLFTDIGLAWGTSAALIAYIGADKFVKEFTTGISFLLGNVWAKGDYVEGYNKYGHVLWKGFAGVVGHHATNTYQKDLKQWVIFNKSLRDYPILNHDRSPFHMLMAPLMIGMPKGGTVQSEVDRVMDMLEDDDIQELIYKLEKEDEDWLTERFEPEMAELYHSPGVNVAMDGLEISIPVKNSVKEMKLRQLLVTKGVIGNGKNETNERSESQEARGPGREARRNGGQYGGDFQYPSGGREHSDEGPPGRSPEGHS